MIELVDFNEIYGKGKGETKEPAKKTRRSRTAKKAEPKAEAAEPATEAPATEAPAKAEE
jgi:large subunit ribosomal protein L17